MASPVIATTAESADAAAGTSHVITMPASVASGDLLIVALDKGSTAATINALSGWTELLDENSANGLYIAYRWSDGTEGASITLTSSASTRCAAIAYRITGAESPNNQPPEIGTTATGTSTTPNPPNVTPTGGAKDYLFIALFGSAGEEADDDTWVTAAPTNFTGLLQKTAGTVGTNLGGLLGSASRGVNASSQDPATFTMAVSAAWRAQTIAIHPAPPPGVTQWSLTASDASVGVQTGPSWAITPDTGTNQVALVLVGAIAPASTTTPATVSATLAGTSSLVAAATAATLITASLAGTSAMTALVTAAPSSTPSLTGTGALTALVAAPVLMTGSLTALGSLTAAPRAPPLIVPALAGTGTLTATVAATGIPQVSGTLAATGALTALVSAQTFLSPALAGTSSMASAVTAPSLISPTVAGVGALAVSTTAAARISPSLAGVGTLAATVSVPTLTGATQWSLTAPKPTAALQTGPSWSITPDTSNQPALVLVGAIAPFSSTPNIAASLAGVGALTATVTAPTISKAFLTRYRWSAGGPFPFAMGFEQLPMAGVGSLTAVVTTGTTPQITASLVGTSALTAAVKTTPVVAPSLAGTSALTASVLALPLISPTLAGVGSLTAAIRTTPRPSGVLAGVGAVSAVVSAKLTFSATLAAQGALTAAIGAGAFVPFTHHPTNLLLDDTPVYGVTLDDVASYSVALDANALDVALDANSTFVVLDDVVAYSLALDDVIAYSLTLDANALDVVLDANALGVVIDMDDTNRPA